MIYDKELMKQRIEPELPVHVSYTIPEHQVLLSFYRDTDAEMFFNWWKEEGLDIFAEWALKNQHHYKGDSL